MKQSNSSQRSKVTDNPPENLFSELKNENYDNTFPVAENWLRGLSKNLSTKSTERKITIMKNYFAVNASIQRMISAPSAPVQGLGVSSKKYLTTCPIIGSCTCCNGAKSKWVV